MERTSSKKERSKLKLGCDKVKIGRKEETKIIPFNCQLILYKVPDLAIVMVDLVFPEEVPSFSMALTRSMPSVTSPKTTCFPSNQEVTTVVMKN